MLRPWRSLVVGETRWFFRLRGAEVGEGGECGVLACATDLRGWWSCTMPAAGLQEQRVANSVETSVVSLVERMIKCFDEVVDAEHYAFELRPPSATAPSVGLSWQVGSSLRLDFECQPHDSPAQLLRDELILPLLCSLEQLEGLVPAGASWTPPSGDLPFPTFRRGLCPEVLQHCTSTHLAQSLRAAAPVAITTSSMSSTALAPHTCAASCQQQQHQPQQPPAAVAVSTAVDETRRREEERARRVHLKREEAAKKAQKRT